MWFLVSMAFALGGLLGAFWDEISEWATNVLEEIFDGINTAIQVFSNAFVSIVKIGNQYYKRLEVYIRDLFSETTRVKFQEVEISEHDIPEEVKEQLTKRADGKLLLLQREVDS
jgi:hypothetical protein